MTSAIRFDTAVPTCREGLFVPVGFAGPEEIVATAVRADELGYHAVWATDLLIPTADYRIPDAEPPNWYDPLVSLAACAVRTERIKLGLGVVMVPFRDPVILAKQVATLDRFAGGRLLLGVGLGFFRMEFEAAQPRLAKAPRGAILDERLEVLIRLLEAGEVSFEGEYANVRGVEMFPKPVQSPVPVYFPGKTPETLHRVAKWGHGLLVPLAMATDRMELLRSLLEERGRALGDRRGRRRRCVPGREPRGGGGALPLQPGRRIHHEAPRRGSGRGRQLGRHAGRGDRKAPFFDRGGHHPLPRRQHRRRQLPGDDGADGEVRHRGHAPRGRVKGDGGQGAGSRGPTDAA